MRTALVVTLLLLAAPSTAFAGRAEVVDGQFRFTGAPGEVNDANISLEGGEYHVVDDGPQKLPTVGPGCRANRDPFGLNYGAYCPADGVTSVAIDLGDRNDFFGIEQTVTVPVSYHGGAGIDQIVYLGSKVGVKISADGKADDGPAGIDNIQPDVEDQTGTEQADTLKAGIEPSVLLPGTGDDSVTGGPGDDTIRVAFVEDVGIFTGGFFEDGVDTATCGGGYDYVLADTHDKVASDCEVVATDRRHGNYGYQIRGSAGKDVIKPREFFDTPVRILGMGGADTLRSNSDDALFGGSGNDVLRPQGGNSRESNHLDGGRGNDRVYSRDHARDFVRCGPGNDRAYVDKRDRVMRDCEHVSRRG